MAAERVCRADDHSPKLGAAPAPANIQLMKEQQQDVAFTISHLEGTLLRDRSCFPFYMLMALEAGSPLRALLLLLLTPILWILSTICTSEVLPIKLQVFVATVGLKLSDVRAVGAAVLPKFFLDDLEPAAYRAFLAAGTSHASRNHRRCIITAYPRPFVEHFLKTHLHIDVLLASELLVTADGTCTGFLLPSQCLLSEDAKREAVENFFYNKQPCAFRPTAGIHVKGSQQHDFLSQCQETILVQQSKIDEKVPTEEYLTPLVFHDGRLVVKPTPLFSLLVFLWAPIGLVLAIIRIVTLTFPYEIGYPFISFLGLRLRVKGPPPLEVPKYDSQQKGVMFVCVHRTLADPTFVALALRHNVRALVFGVSKLSEFLTPIPSARLTRNREEDATIMKKWLEKEDLCICPEGTTCREPYLLRFSPLFADVADWVAPVGVEVKTSIFHGTSARGYKFMDGLFLFMNPTFAYEVTFLDPICTSELRKSGKSAIEIANLVQKQLGAAMGFKCTNFTRRDKYFLLAGHDGTSK